MGIRSSEHLTPGTIYSREQLKELFGISDATINTGVFRPHGHDSVWLFVTEDKTPDRTQYRDELIGDELHWEGQSAGRTDRLIVEHRINGLELLLFRRKRKYEHPNAGFRYEGTFEYICHAPGDASRKKPSRFVLRRLQL